SALVLVDVLALPVRKVIGVPHLAVRLADSGLVCGTLGERREAGRGLGCTGRTTVPARTLLRRRCRTITLEDHREPVAELGNQGHQLFNSLEGVFYLVPKVRSVGTTERHRGGSVASAGLDNRGGVVGIRRGRDHRGSILKRPCGLGSSRSRGKRINSHLVTPFILEKRTPSDTYGSTRGCSQLRRWATVTNVKR